MLVFTKMKNISMKVLANDGVSQSGIDALTNAGIEVITTKVAQEQLVNYINENNLYKYYRLFKHYFNFYIVGDFQFDEIEPLLNQKN